MSTGGVKGVKTLYAGGLTHKAPLLHNELFRFFWGGGMTGRHKKKFPHCKPAVISLIAQGWRHQLPKTGTFKTKTGVLLSL